MSFKQKSLVVFFMLCCINLNAQGLVDIAESQDLYGLPNDFYSSGVSFVDFDQDGDDDITLGSGTNFPILFFENKNGSFEQLSFVNELVQIMQVTWVDYDNDGDLDFSYNSDAGMKLHENVGGMVFEDVTASLNLEDIDCEGYPICWADFDKDGDLDFFLTQFCFPYTGALQYYKNNGDKSFSFANDEAGIDQDWAIYTIAGSVLDYNNDGWEDFYMTIDFLERNVLLRNNGDGTFSNVSQETGTDLAMDGMSSTVGDIDLDGDMDIYVTNSYYDFRPDEHNKLLLNDGSESFDEVAESWNVLGDDWSWGAQLFDVDGDFDLDLMVNEILSVSRPSNLYINDYENQTFILDNSTVSYNTEGYVYGYGSAIGDFNNDGYPDLFSNTNDRDVILLRNEWNDNNWLKVNLTGVESNLMGIGTRIECYVGGMKLIRHQRCGEAYVSQNSYTQFFGLSNETNIDSLILKWPSGVVDKYYNLDVNNVIQCIEGQELLVDFSFNGFWDKAACENGDGDLVLAFQGGTLPYTYEVQSIDGEIVATGDIIEHPGRAILNLPMEEYKVVMIDALMNELNSTVYKVSRFESPSFSDINITDATTDLLANGEINLSGTGGLAPYDFQLFDEQGEEVGVGSSIGNLTEGTYLAQVTDANNCSSTETINIGLISGLDHFILDAIKVFPNPASEILSISIPESFVGQIHMEDAQGKSLKFIPSDLKDQTIDLADLSNGIYFLVFYNSDGTQAFSKRVVVAK